MRYLGGKAKANLGKKIAQVIGELRGERDTYIEPFLGGANVLEHVDGFDRYFAGDAHQDLILMWQSLAQGWVPPESVSEDEYRILKRHGKPSAIRGFVGFGCSFGAKWFAGFNPMKDSKHGTYSGLRASVMNQVHRIARAHITHCDFEEWSGWIGPSSVVYCDPPYAGTTGYKSTSRFDHERFWRVMREWSKVGALVLVSEEIAPPDWVCVWQQARRACVGAHVSKPPRIEKLWAFSEQKQTWASRASSS